MQVCQGREPAGQPQIAGLPEPGNKNGKGKAFGLKSWGEPPNKQAVLQLAGQPAAATA